MIAILGTGLLGSGFARALRKKGETVHVWNRTAARAKALEADGCIAYADAARAVRGARRRSDRTASPVRLRARSSRTCPRRTSVVMTAAAS